MSLAADTKSHDESTKRARPAVHISFARQADVPAMAQIYLLAFHGVVLQPVFAPQRIGLTITELLSRDGPDEERKLRRSLVGNDIFVKASVHTDDGLREMVVGWARWTNATGRRRRSVWDWLWSEVLYPLYQFLFRPAISMGLPSAVREMFELQYMDVFGPGRTLEGRKHWHLHMICVHPNSQGVGIGGALMNWGMEKAREDDAAVYLESSRLGMPVYLSKGFRIVAERPRNINGCHARVPSMIWEPRLGPDSTLH